MLQLILLRPLSKHRGGSRDNFPDWWFDEQRVFECQYLPDGSGSAWGRLSSLLTVRSSQGIEWRARFSREPLSISLRAGLSGERIWRARSGCARHLHISTHGAVVNTHSLWIVEGTEFHLKSPRFLCSCGRSSWKCKGGPPGGKRKGGFGIQR